MTDEVPREISITVQEDVIVPKPQANIEIKGPLQGPETYAAFIHCNNCGQPAITRVPKGVSIADALFHAAIDDHQTAPPCPYCGVKSQWEPGIEYRRQDSRQPSRRPGHYDPDVPTLQLQAPTDAQNPA